MARTGLRMMPMFPSSPLKFRTAGFPQYGFKASLSDGACLPPLAVKRAPHMPAPSGSLLRPLPASATERWRGAVSPPVRASTDRCARGPASLPQGVLGSAAGCVVPLPHCLLRPHPPVSPARGDFTAVPLIRRAFAVRERRGDPRETFLTFPAVLATRAADPTSGGSRAPLPLSARVEYQATSDYQRVATHKGPSLPAILDGVMHFGAASFASCYGSCVCQALLTGYDEVGSYALHFAS
jgi:hypothetical protein